MNRLRRVTVPLHYVLRVPTYMCGSLCSYAMLYMVVAQSARNIVTPRNILVRRCCTTVFLYIFSEQ
jgi:hypothetical protein